MNNFKIAQRSILSTKFRNSCDEFEEGNKFLLYISAPIEYL